MFQQVSCVRRAGISGREQPLGPQQRGHARAHTEVTFVNCQKPGDNRTALKTSSENDKQVSFHRPGLTGAPPSPQHGRLGDTGRGASRRPLGVTVQSPPEPHTGLPETRAPARGRERAEAGSALSR